jgi:hypothetical protein
MAVSPPRFPHQRERLIGCDVLEQLKALVRRTTSTGSFAMAPVKWGRDRQDKTSRWRHREGHAIVSEMFMRMRACSLRILCNARATKGRWNRDIPIDRCRLVICDDRDRARRCC